MTLRSKLLQFFLVLGTVTLTVTAVFIQYGLNVNGVLEEYLFMLASEYRSVWLAEVTSSQYIMRPVTFPFWMAIYGLTPYSYFGHNLVNYALIIAKGVLLYYVLKQVGLSRSVSLAIALLFAIYPTNSMGTRLTVAIPAVTVTYLIALLCLLRLHERWHWFDAICMMLALAATTLIYEIAYPLIFVTPLLLVILNRGLSRRIFRLGMLWYLTPALVAIRWLYYFITLGESFQANKLASVDNSLPTLFGHLIGAYKIILGVGWYETLFSVYNARLIHFIIVSVVTLILFFIFGRIQQAEAENAPDNQRLWVGIGIGLLVIAVGYSAVIITFIRTFYERVFGLSAIGAAVVLICLLTIITAYLGRSGRIIWRLAVVGLIGLALFAGLIYREYDVHGAFEQQAIASDVVETMPATTASAVVVFSPGSDFILERAVEMPLQIVYETLDISAYVCYDGYIDRVVTSCQFGEDSIAFITRDGTETARYDEIVAFDYLGDGNVQLLQELPPEYVGTTQSAAYDPSALICADCAYPPRVDIYFSSFPFSIPAGMDADNRLRHLIYALRGSSPDDR